MQMQLWFYVKPGQLLNSEPRSDYVFTAAPWQPAGPLGTTSTGAALCQLDTAGRLISSRKPPGARKQMFVKGGSGRKCACGEVPVTLLVFHVPSNSSSAAHSLIHSLSHSLTHSVNQSSLTNQVTQHRHHDAQRQIDTS